MSRQNLSRFWKLQTVHNKIREMILHHKLQTRLKNISFILKQKITLFKPFTVYWKIAPPCVQYVWLTSPLETFNNYWSKTETIIVSWTYVTFWFTFTTNCTENLILDIGRSNSLNPLEGQYGVRYLCTDEHFPITWSIKIIKKKQSEF